MSACTSNTRRVTLQETLLTAYPREWGAVDACRTGNPVAVSALLSDLEATGLGHDDHALLFWPLSSGIPEVLEIQKPPGWFEILRDTDISACFAVVSGRCLPFSAQDQHRLIGRLCSSQSSDGCALRTMIELNPDGGIQLPLKTNARLKLACRSLQVRNESVSTHLAFYEARGRFSRARSRGHTSHKELLVPSRSSRNTVEFCILDRPRS